MNTSATPWRVHTSWPVDIVGRARPYRGHGFNYTAAWAHADREWATREQAIRSAKALHRLHGSEVEIHHETATDSRPVAYVRSDALGRVWVDVMSLEAGKLI